MSNQAEMVEIKWRRAPYGYLSGEISADLIIKVLSRLSEENIHVKHQVITSPTYDPITWEEAGFDDFTHVFTVAKAKSSKVRSILRKLLPKNEINGHRPRPVYPQPPFPEPGFIAVEIDPTELRGELRQAFPGAEVRTDDVYGYDQWRIWIEQGARRVEFDWGAVSGFGATDRGKRKKAAARYEHPLHSIEEAIQFVRQAFSQTTT